MSDGGEPPARRPRVSGAAKEAVRVRANHCCEYCKSRHDLATQGFAAEHIIPRDQGGANELENIALSCPGCNNHKFTKTSGTDSATQEFVRLFHPRRDSWNDHFEWSADKKRIVGRTAIGRATVDTLQMNRERLIRQRTVFIAAGEHPPTEPASQ